jgi:hypothetical protein
MLMLGVLHNIATPDSNREQHAHIYSCEGAADACKQPHMQLKRF